MELTAELMAPCVPDELFGWIDDLTRYPQWMGLVHAADPIEPEAAAPLSDRQDTGVPAWNVELRARIGPFARSKRLTMIRTVCEPNTSVVFERHETDGRQHSLWRLGVAVEPIGTGSRMEMRLHYGGSLWTGGLMERVLHDEITRSRERLVRLLAETRL